MPLIPMALWGTQRLWTKGRKRDFGRNHFPVPSASASRCTAEADEPAARLTSRLRERVQELLEAAQRAYPATPKGPHDSWWLPAHLGGTAPTPAEAKAMSGRQPQRGRTDPRSDGGRGRTAGPARHQRSISSRSAARKPSTSSSVVSKEHIQRTSPAASSQK